ncbi:hypothetical protein BDN71DRAFT_1437068 [Pleurotus eryngii]|uniref:Uncharacterized protein n=1 Tax=Pleurotus eryngii TaxID=5323 RepID=A0A9P6D170_PLEER|nr:hypothetical protein BDN71DRAFT_1437068 [Pleurotus eryngii]
MSANTYTFSASVSLLKISPPPHELLAVGDMKGVLMIHWLSRNLEIFCKKIVGHGCQLITIIALTWNPQHLNKLYVGFANRDDPSSFLTFEGPIHNLVITPSPSEAELFVVFGTSVVVVYEGTQAYLTIPIPLDSCPTRLIFDMLCIIVIFMVTEPGVSPAAIAYDLYSHEVHWTLFTSCDDMISTGGLLFANGISEMVMPSSRSRSIWMYSAIALLMAMGIIYFQANEGSAIAMSSLSTVISEISFTVVGSPEPPTLSPSVLSSLELPLPESPLSSLEERNPSSDTLSSSLISSPDPPSSSASDLPPPNSPALAPEPSSQVQGSPISIQSSDYQPKEPDSSPVHETESELGHSSPLSGSDSSIGLAAPVLDNPKYMQLPLAPSTDQHFGQVSPPCAHIVPSDHPANPVTINTPASAATVTIIHDVQIEKASVGSYGGLIFGIILEVTMTLISMAFHYNFAAVHDWFARDFSTTPQPSAAAQPISSTLNFKPTSSTSTTSAKVKNE